VKNQPIMSNLMEKSSSDKSFAYGLSIIHKIIERGETYSDARKELKKEKNFEDSTIDRLIESVKKTRRNRAEKGEEKSQPQAEWDENEDEEKDEVEDEEKDEVEDEEKDEVEDEEKDEVEDEEKEASMVNDLVKMATKILDKNDLGNVFLGISDHKLLPVANKLLEEKKIKGYAIVSEKMASRKNGEKYAQSPSSWEPLPDTGTKVEPNQWFNLSWDALMGKSRESLDDEDLRNVSLDKRLWKFHDNIPEILYEKKLSESRDVVKKLEKDDYWGEDKKQTIEGRLVEEGKNDISSTWQGDISQLEKGRVR